MRKRRREDERDGVWRPVDDGARDETERKRKETVRKATRAQRQLGALLVRVPNIADARNLDEIGWRLDRINVELGWILPLTE